MGTIIGAAIAVPALYRRVDEEIRRRAEERFAQHYRSLSVTIRSARLREGEGIELRGLKFLEPEAEGPRAELLDVEEVFLELPGKLGGIAPREPDICRIIVRRPRLRVTPADGSWSTSRLLPLPKFSHRSPQVVIENATVEIVDPLKTTPSTFTLRDVNFVLAPPEQTDQPSAGMHCASSRNLHGRFRQVSFEGLFNPHEPQWTMGGTVEGLEVSRARETRSMPLADRLAELGLLRGLVKLGFRVTNDPATGSGASLRRGGDISQANIDDARLPHPMTDLRAKFRVSNDGIAIDGLFATSARRRCGAFLSPRAGFGPKVRSGWKRRSGSWN